MFTGTELKKTRRQTHVHNKVRLRLRQPCAKFCNFAWEVIFFPSRAAHHRTLDTNDKLVSCFWFCCFFCIAQALYAGACACAISKREIVRVIESRGYNSITFAGEAQSITSVIDAVSH